MILIKHRINKIEDLKKIPKNLGVEIDIRSKNNDLILHHDPFSKAVNLNKWLKYYKHKIIIANVKEEGIEKKIIKIFKKHKITNYFLLDVTTPKIVEITKQGFKKIALRVSQFEDYKRLIFFKKKAKWIWLDTFFGKMPISSNEIKILKKNNFKICLVSPELPTKKIESIVLFKKQHSKEIKLIDAVCTKFPDMWY